MHQARLRLEEKLAKEPQPTEEEIFKEHPLEDCPICFLPFQRGKTLTDYFPCCCVSLCRGCVVSYWESLEPGEKRADFCRVPHTRGDEDSIRMLKKRVEVNDAMATFKLGAFYMNGYGVAQNLEKGMELTFRAAELGSACAHNDIGFAYSAGPGLETDVEKAIYHYQISLMLGFAPASHALGLLEHLRGNKETALKCWIHSAKAGFEGSLKEVKKCFIEGVATKEQFEMALRAQKEAEDGVKSPNRERVAAMQEAGLLWE